MKAWIRWQDWVTIASGVTLILAPWIFGLLATTAFAIDAWFVGVLTIAASVGPLAQPQRFVTEWITLLLGIWLFLSPRVLSFLTESTATTAAWIIGLLLIVTSGLTLGGTRRFHAGVPT
ncbi:MAG TPA: SPW repeat protein [Ktedonobacteraceae bacterium]|jgi:hypothetical protein